MSRGTKAATVASIVGIFYDGYSPFSLVAGVALDRIGPRNTVPIGAATVGFGALLFASGSSSAASFGRFLQGAGGVFALVGAAYIVTTNFPPSRAATLIGATQMVALAIVLTFFLKETGPAARRVVAVPVQEAT